jgi:hypothetical protein
VDSGVTAEVDDDVREGGLWLHQRERERERERESSRGFWKVTGPLSVCQGGNRTRKGWNISTETPQSLEMLFTIRGGENFFIYL